MSHKQELLNRAAQEYMAFHEAIDGLNEEHLTEVWLGTWSIRDIVAHMSGWHREIGPALERLARGEKPVLEGVSYEDADAWNEKFVAASRGTPIADVLLEFDRSHADFLKAADQVPEARYDPSRTAYKLVDLNSAHHYTEHGDQVRAWRSSRGL